VARIYTFEEAPRGEGQKWERTILIKMHPASIPNYGELERWLSFNFKGWFCLIAHLTQTMRLSTHIPDRDIQVDHYEIRCEGEDADRFVAIWTIPAREYQENLAHERELNGRRQGWVRFEGKTVPLHEVIAIVKEAPKAKLKKLLAKAYK